MGIRLAVGEFGFDGGEGFTLAWKAEHGLSFFETDPFERIMLVVQDNLGVTRDVTNKDRNDRDAFLGHFVELLTYVR